jgi:hypothetical protein
MAVDKSPAPTLMHKMVSRKYKHQTSSGEGQKGKDMHKKDNDFSGGCNCKTMFLSMSRPPVFASRQSTVTFVPAERLDMIVGLNKLALWTRRSVGRDTRVLEIGISLAHWVDIVVREI